MQPVPAFAPKPVVSPSSVNVSDAGEMVTRSTTHASLLDDVVKSHVTSAAMGMASLDTALEAIVTR